MNLDTDSGDCPIFKNVNFEDISVTGATRAGDIAGFKGALLQGLSFKNVTFGTLPEEGWHCGYVNLTSFAAVDVAPPINCNVGVPDESSGL